jgi:hypothetical protein
MTVMDHAVPVRAPSAGALAGPAMAALSRAAVALLGRRVTLAAGSVVLRAKYRGRCFQAGELLAPVTLRLGWWNRRRLFGGGPSAEYHFVHFGRGPHARHGGWTLAVAARPAEGRAA